MSGVATAANEPTIPAGNLTIFNTNCNELEIVWSIGDGSQHLVVVSENPIMNYPADGVGYTASTQFGSGSNLGGGTFVVSANSGTNTTVTGLTGGLTYYVAVFEYNGNGVAANYLISVFPTISEIVLGTVVSVSATRPTICQGDTSILSAQSSDPNTYIWNPTTALVSFVDSIALVFPILTTTYSVTATAPNGCTATASIQVVVNPKPSVSLSGLSDVCINSAPYTLTGGLPVGGSYSGAHVLAGIFYPNTAGIGLDTIVYTYTNPSGCSNSATAYINVNNVPNVALATFAPVCANTAPFPLTGGIPVGGAYSGPGVAGGIFTPSLVGVGTKSIIYTYFAPNGCQNSDTANLLVLALPQVNLTSLPSVCPESNAFVLSGGSPIGGTYSGSGVSGGQFDPAVTGPGSFPINYLYTDGNGCSNLAVSTLVVYNSPTVNFAPPASLCNNGPSVLLSGGTPSGGVYSGNYVTAGRFNPTASGSGRFAIMYDYIDVNGCAGIDIDTIVVNAAPIVDLVSPPSLCENAAPLQLNTGTPSGGTYTGNGIAANVFNPALVDTGSTMIYYQYIDNNGCTSRDSAIIRVNPLPVVTVSSFPARCVNGGPLALTGGSPAGGTYSGPGVGGSTFYTAIAGVGTHNIIYTYTSPFGCTATATQSLIVNPAPTVALGPDTTLCAGNSILLNAGNTGSSYAWSTGATTQTLTIDTTGRGVGAFSIRITVTTPQGCINKDTVVVTFAVCAGITEESIGSVITYPNPFHHTAVIDVDDSGELFVFDQQGRLLIRQLLIAGKNIVGEELMEGSYIGRIYANDKSYTIRLIKD